MATKKKTPAEGAKAPKAAKAAGEKTAAKGAKAAKAAKSTWQLKRKPLQAVNNPAMNCDEPNERLEGKNCDKPQVA